MSQDRQGAGNEGLIAELRAHAQMLVTAYDGSQIGQEIANISLYGRAADALSALAEVRRETIEECAEVVESVVRENCTCHNCERRLDDAKAIRALHPERE